jgi:enamine deaminase RidA (YjgF/YER057c/UK114 family)
MEKLNFKTFESEEIVSHISFYHPDGKTHEAHLLITSKPGLDTIQSWHFIQVELYRAEEELNFSHPSHLFLRVFCSDAVNQEKVLRENYPDFFSHPRRFNISFVQQPPMPGSKLAVWAFLVKGKFPVERLGYGNIFHSNGLTHIWTANLSGDGSENTFRQTEQMFLSYIDLLDYFKSNLLDNAIRTWVFVRDVDTIYPDVVKARKMVFEKQGLNENTHYIASTGIEGKNENSARLSFLDTYSIAGINNKQVKYLQVPGFMCPTHLYGVTFERGVTISFGDRKHVYISGTASIDQHGHILYPGDVVMQTSRTLENIGSLLKEAGAALADMAYIFVYIRDIADFQIVRKVVSEKLPGIPVLILLAPICRPAWLVEIEGLAICNTPSEWPDF